MTKKVHDIVHYIWYDYISVKIYMHSYLSKHTKHTHFSICGVKKSEACSLFVSSPKFGGLGIFNF